MLDYSSLAAVSAVVREGTFEAAAAVLGHTPSAVSQRVRALEERLGAVLIHRGRPCKPTVLGRRLCDHVDRVRLLEQDLGPVLRQNGSLSESVATIPIAVNADSMATWFAGAVADFSSQTAVTLDIKLDDEARTSDRLRSGEVFAAVSANPAPIPGCKTIPLGSLSYAACASPDFMERYFESSFSVEKLVAAPFLRFDQHDQLQARWLNDVYHVKPGKMVHWVPSTHGFLDLGLSAVGWGMHPIELVGEHLRSGRLIELPPAIRIKVKLYWIVARLHGGAIDQLTRVVQRAATRGLQYVDI